MFAAGEVSKNRPVSTVMFNFLCDRKMTSQHRQVVWGLQALLQALDETPGVCLAAEWHIATIQPDDPATRGRFGHANVHGVLPSG
jgi:hypothetical protein